MANLKNITELPLAESVEGLNLIVNDNGAAKQIAISEVGVQADFAQNDSSAPDYVKNRTHYVEEEVVLERQTIEFAPMEEMDGMCMAMLPDIPTIPDGKVTVFWDGVEYNCVSTNGQFGNEVFFSGQDSGEPFVFGYEGVYLVLDVNGTVATSHEIGITREVPVKIDKQFLPDDVCYLRDGEEFLRTTFDINKFYRSKYDKDLLNVNNSAEERDIQLSKDDFLLLLEFIESKVCEVFVDENIQNTIWTRANINGNDVIFVKGLLTYVNDSKLYVANYSWDIAWVADRDVATITREAEYFYVNLTKVS